MNINPYWARKGVLNSPIIHPVGSMNINPYWARKGD
jgi:hypothetical protein